MVRQATAATHAVEAQVTANPLSPLLGVSYALDFRDYFNDVVAFELRRQQLILLDRWRPCVLAVADMCGADSDVIRDVIRPIPEADLTVFVRVDPAKARRRIETRGQPAFDEGIATLRALEASYERTLTHERGLIVEVVNDDLETAVAFLGGLVGGLAASRLDATHRQLLSVRARPMHPTESVA
jgi:thymidylate kinase